MWLLDPDLTYKQQQQQHIGGEGVVFLHIVFPNRPPPTKKNIELETVACCIVARAQKREIFSRIFF